MSSALDNLNQYLVQIDQYIKRANAEHAEKVGQLDKQIQDIESQIAELNSKVEIYKQCEKEDADCRKISELDQKRRAARLGYDDLLKRNLTADEQIAQLLHKQIV